MKPLCLLDIALPSADFLQGPVALHDAMDTTKKYLANLLGRFWPLFGCDACLNCTILEKNLAGSPPWNLLTLR